MIGWRIYLASLLLPAILNVVVVAEASKLLTCQSKHQCQIYDKQCRTSVDDSSWVVTFQATAFNNLSHKSYCLLRRWLASCCTRIWMTSNC